MTTEYVYIGEDRNDIFISYGDVISVNNGIVKNCTNNEQLSYRILSSLYTSLIYYHTSIISYEYSKLMDKLKIVCKFLVCLNNIKVLGTYGKGVYIVKDNYTEYFKVGDIVSNVDDTSFLLSGRQVTSTYHISNLHAFAYELKDIETIDKLCESYSNLRFKYGSNVYKLETLLEQLKREL